MSTGRPTLMGTRHMVSACHYLAAMAGARMLENGGNAVDAGVAAGLTLSVVESTSVSFGGVAPIAVFMKDTGKVLTISGLGGWPRRASAEHFWKEYGGAMPKGVLGTVVPGAPDAWIMALEQFGTVSFGEAAAFAIEMARDGFPMYPLMSNVIANGAAAMRKWPSSAAMYLPNDAPPPAGQVFRQEDLGRTMQYMADQEAAVASKGRVAGLRAAHDAFYRGDIAAAMVRFHNESGGWLTMEDLDGFRSDIETAIQTSFAGVDVYSCGPWCQGPMLLQQLAILEGMDLRSVGHNTAEYIHLVTETIKLSAADREAYYGDPKFIDVPMERLLSPEYAAQRRALIDPDRAFPYLPPPGLAGDAVSPGAAQVPEGLRLDTSYVCVVDRHGNAFSATPSDSATAGPVAPGLGFVPSPRGFQSWTQPDHPSSIQPGKRPRLTPNPSIAMKDGKFVMPFGTPGLDNQTQVMLQGLLNMFAFGMDLQEAVEAPRFCTLSFPSSSAPHEGVPGRLLLEPTLYDAFAGVLAEMGHKPEPYPESGPDYFTYIPGLCVVQADFKTGIVKGGADPRKPSYAIGR